MQIWISINYVFAICKNTIFIITVTKVANPTGAKD
jgi:hypothetical protein